MKIWLVDDDSDFLRSLTMSFEAYKSYEVKSFNSPKRALNCRDEVDVVISDLKMSSMNGLDFLRNLQKCRAKTYKTIIITAHGSLQDAKEAIDLGVFGFITKDSNNFEEILKKLKTIEKISLTQASMPIKLNTNLTSTSKLPSFKSAAMQDIISRAKKIALTQASVLLLGESGVGKEVLARFIHEHSLCANGPFIAHNMASIPSDLLESELFGYEKGAFTGADRPKKGLFELADNGTFFLDEIGEMPINLQAKLLRVIENNEVIPLGATKSFKINVRFIAATNANIGEKIRQKLFREDLFFRIGTTSFEIPPLRERKEDIIEIANEQLAIQCKRYNKRAKFSDEARDAMLEYYWYGNVRELLSSVEEALILCESEEISAQDLNLAEKRKIFDTK